MLPVILVKSSFNLSADYFQRSDSDDKPPSNFSALSNYFSAYVIYCFNDSAFDNDSYKFLFKVATISYTS